MDSTAVATGARAARLTVSAAISHACATCFNDFVQDACTHKALAVVTTVTTLVCAPVTKRETQNERDASVAA